MSESKHKSKKNMTIQHRQLLCSIIYSHRVDLQDESLQNISQAWKKICDEYNEKCTDDNRTLDQIKFFYKNMKSKLKHRSEHTKYMDFFEALQVYAVNPYGEQSISTKAEPDFLFISSPNLANNTTASNSSDDPFWPETSSNNIEETPNKKLKTVPILTEESTKVPDQHDSSSMDSLSSFSSCDSEVNLKTKKLRNELITARIIESKRKAEFYEWKTKLIKYQLNQSKN